MSDAVVIDPGRLGVRRMPVGPPVRADGSRWVWIVTRYEDAVRALRTVPSADVRDELEFMQRARAIELPGLVRLLSGTLVARCDPFHARGRAFLREVVSTPVSDEVMREHAQAVLAAVPVGEPVDLVPVLSRIPLGLLAIYLGLPGDVLEALEARLRRVTTDWGGPGRNRSLADLDEQSEAILDDLCALLAQSRGRGDPARRDCLRLGRETFGLEDRDSLALVSFLLVASVDSTMGLLSTMALLLGAFPDLRRLAESEATQAGFVEETLRLLPSVRLASRRLLHAPFEAAGRILPPGTTLHVSLEAANRDPRAFPDPWHFRPDRRGPQHLAFGIGPHACLGGRVARRLGRHALRALTGYRVTPLGSGPPDWGPHPAFLILKTLPCVLEPL